MKSPSERVEEKLQEAELLAIASVLSRQLRKQLLAYGSKMVRLEELRVARDGPLC